MYDEVIGGLVRRMQQDYTDALEQACEAALQTGTCGVLVERFDPRFVADEENVDLVRLDPAWKITVSPDVPYGMIYEMLP